MGLSIAELDLTDVAAAGAAALLKAYPEIVFTSGRRSIAAQAKAMAHNLVLSGRPDWIARTYRHSPVVVRLEEWVVAHQLLLVHRQEEEIAEGLRATLAKFNPPTLRTLSLHLSGRAFDVQPMPGRADVERSIGKLRGITKFLSHEAGLVRWHLEF